MQRIIDGRNYNNYINSAPKVLLVYTFADQFSAMETKLKNRLYHVGLIVRGQIWKLNVFPFDSLTFRVGNEHAEFLNSMFQLANCYIISMVF